MKKAFNYWWKAIFEKAIDFKSRSNRYEYWSFTLITWVVQVILSNMAALANGVTLSLGSSMMMQASLLIPLVIIGLLFAVPELSVSVRRLHDTGRSGWWFFINCVPVIGNLIFVIFMLKSGDNDENKYGVVAQ